MTIAVKHCNDWLQYMFDVAKERASADIINDLKWI